MSRWRSCGTPRRIPAIKNQRVNYEALRERQQDGRHAGSVYVNS